MLLELLSSRFLDLLSGGFDFFGLLSLFLGAFLVRFDVVDGFDI
jgi:hypothetical protein